MKKEAERGSECLCPGCSKHIEDKGLGKGLKGFCKACSSKRFGYPKNEVRR